MIPLAAVTADGRSRVMAVVVVSCDQGEQQRCSHAPRPSRHIISHVSNHALTTSVASYPSPVPCTLASFVASCPDPLLGHVARCSHSQQCSHHPDIIVTARAPIPPICRILPGTQRPSSGTEDPLRRPVTVVPTLSRTGPESGSGCRSVLPGGGSRRWAWSETRRRRVTRNAPRRETWSLGRSVRIFVTATATVTVTASLSTPPVRCLHPSERLITV